MRRLFAPGVAAALLTSTWAEQGRADSVHWKTLGIWDISFYEDDQGCSAYAEFEGGVGVYLGLVDANADPHLEILVYNPDWRSIEQDREYDITLQAGDASGWDLTMYGIRADDERGLAAYYPADTDVAGGLVDDLIKHPAVEMWYRDRSLGRLTLAGFGGAFEEVVSCTHSHRGTVVRGPDPFAAPDPFAEPSPADTRSSFR